MDVTIEKLKASATGTNPVDCNLKEYVNKINYFFFRNESTCMQMLSHLLISDRRVY